MYHYTDKQTSRVKPGSLVHYIAKFISADLKIVLLAH